MVGKVRLDEPTMALRVAKEFQDGMVVNLGVGIGTQCMNYVPEGREVLFHTENGALGLGPIVSSPEEADINLTNAGGQPVHRTPGMSFFSHDEAFVMIRGKHVDMVVLGAMEVSEKGDLANWVLPGRGLGNIGGSMDLAQGAKKVVAVMTHTTRDGRPKILKKCSLPLTAPRCVSLIVTDIAVIEVGDQGLVLKEIAPGWTPEEVQEITEPGLILAPDLKEIDL
ncbi:MAG: succinyl-CoA--3-ketoacid-CoA transferase [Chloroflexi bacterium RBG_16_58_8]|nr:MAG: succinyl-CoA--3-ketoacid-CoA transferase [Chloroflexi bacterium RBG_16_58_8]